MEDSEENLEEALAYVNEKVDSLQPLSDFAIGMFLCCNFFELFY